MSGPAPGGPAPGGLDERAPLILLLDTSASMGNPPEAPRIAKLNTALRDWVAEAGNDQALRDRLEVAVITFGSSPRILRWPDADPGAGLGGHPW